MVMLAVSMPVAGTVTVPSCKPPTFDADTRCIVALPGVTPEALTATFVPGATGVVAGVSVSVPSTVMPPGIVVFGATVVVLEPGMVVVVTV
jgi:hypothetical protein